MKKPTQLERVITAARRFNGVCQADFLGDTVDGLPNITRVAARIEEAEGRGYTFECIGWRSKTKVFRLVSEPETPRLAATRAAATQADGERLFDTAPEGTPHWRSEAA